jgi:hypothetical protein
MNLGPDNLRGIDMRGCMKEALAQRSAFRSACLKRGLQLVWAGARTRARWCMSSLTSSKRKVGS